ncbi:o-succinylbenzoate--CoA ligase [Rhodococcus sp. 06-1477-1B]|nr:o-succinylbenzoate--CoA ligase [Rhodococcus sp. 06-1477-1B]
MIVVVDGESPDLLERIGEVRAAGRAVLIADPRWSAAQRAGVEGLASRTEVPVDIAWATLTSGSSGDPRIVLRSAASWTASFAAVSTLLDARPDDTVSLPAPPAASLTLFSLAHALEGGPRPAPGVDVDATLAHVTPQGLRALLDAGGRPRCALVGGSQLDPALRARAEAAGVRVVSYYGAAELSFVAIDTGDGLRAFPGVELQIRGEQVWVRSPFVAHGYLGAAGPLERSGEWATVGDRAELRDGRLRLRGRRDGALLSASATVVPDEVETVLREIPGVRDAVVFGMPRPGIGVLVAAFVETEGDGPLDLRADAAERLAPAHRPRRWFFGRIPRTLSGKPARAEVERLAAAMGRSRG